ncbi:MAG: DUF3500 domain-containing protein [Pirellulales bacterium]
MKTVSLKTPQRLVLLVALLAVAGGWAFVNRDDPGVGMTAAAEKFVASLSNEQRAVAVMDYDSPKRVGWHFIPMAERKGLQVKHMTEEQRKAAHALLRSALSQIGYDKSTTIMTLESVLHELEKSKGGGAIRDAQRYYFTVFGKPAADGKWGLSVEGHHLSLNFVVDKNELVGTTPQFLGANPATIQGSYPVGPKKGSRLLADEEVLGFTLANSLSKEQLATALIDKKAPADLRGAGTPQPPTEKPVGVAAKDLTADQQQTLRKLIDVYAKTMPAAVAEARLAASEKAGFDNIQFAWAGAMEPGIGHYYRIEGPTFQIEFCNTQPDSAGNPANHIHSMWRDTAGDFAIPVKE